MPLVQSKQINKMIAGRVGLPAVAFTAGVGVSTVDVTANLTTALATAGDGGVAVPLQQHIANTQPGVFTGASNIADLYDAVTKLKLTDGTADNKEVFGRISFAAGAYTLSLFTKDATGADVAFVPAANLSIDVSAQYVFTFATLPVDFATTLKGQFVQDDPASGNRTKFERLTVTALNTLSALSLPYAAGPAKLIINGQIVTNMDAAGTPNAAGAPFTLTAASSTVTWDPVAALYNLETTDVVEVEYTF